MEYVMFGGTVMMFCNVLSDICAIFFAFGVILWATHVCFSIIEDFKTGMNNIDMIICKIKMCHKSKILLLLMVLCFEISFVLGILFMLVSVCIGG